MHDGGEVLVGFEQRAQLAGVLVKRQIACEPAMECDGDFAPLLADYCDDGIGTFGQPQSGAVAWIRLPPISVPERSNSGSALVMPTGPNSRLRRNSAIAARRVAGSRLRVRAREAMSARMTVVAVEYSQSRPGSAS